MDLYFISNIDLIKIHIEEMCSKVNDILEVMNDKIMQSNKCIVKDCFRSSITNLLRNSSIL